MTRIITYSLQPGARSSDAYYRTISALADSWLSGTLPQLRDLVSGFRQYRQAHGETDRSDAEYAFELLAMGVLLREHGREAGCMPGWTALWMARLVDLQNRQPRLEPIIKGLRGWLGWMARGFSGRNRSEDIVESLIAWLGAGGETVKQTRLRQWQAYFKSGGTSFTQAAVSRCLQLAEEFAERSRSELGRYTQNVEHFLSVEASKKRRRYDARLLTQTRLEYHLGMLGTEILNRAYRERFLATRQKMVILPPCMCAPEKVCKAVETPLGAQCQACTPGCRVHQITKLGEKLGFHVTMIPDDVKVFGSGREAGSVGLVGVSCALTNWNGGWETGDLHIPAQGLLLDYVGCKYHWDRKGIPTDTSLKKLREILDA